MRGGLLPVVGRVEGVERLPVGRHVRGELVDRGLAIRLGAVAHEAELGEVGVGLRDRLTLEGRVDRRERRADVPATEDLAADRFGERLGDLVTRRLCGSVDHPVESRNRVAAFLTCGIGEELSVVVGEPRAIELEAPRDVRDERQEPRAAFGRGSARCHGRSLIAVHVGSRYR